MFKPIKAQRVFEQVVDQIRAQIASGTLKPGDKLPPERELAETFSISRNAVREALRTMEMSGTIRLVKGVRGGAFITEGDPSFLANGLRDMLLLGSITFKDLAEARLWVESIACRVVCERATEEHFRELEDNIEESIELAKQQRYEEKDLVGIEFHNILAAATGNPVLVLNVKMLMDMMRNFARQVPPQEGMETIEARKKLVRDLRSRDPDKADESLHNLMRLLLRRFEGITYQMDEDE
ncbi:MAG: FCD domain-containing protein [Gammaproteobacteria bacterium]|nr:FCD domain-containing protein [Gammaproteobacteria bacterium]